MPSKKARPYLYKLDEIEVAARRRFAYCTHLYIYCVSTEFMRYWRELQRDHSHEIPNILWNELYFYFNEKLLEIVRCRLDLMWMIYEYDDNDLFHDDFVFEKFWRNGYKL